MKYIANPVEVDAFVITRIEPNSDGGFHLWFDNGGDNNATPEMCSRMTPTVGDYWVIQSDGYVYLNPKDVFLRKYHPVDHYYSEKVNESLEQGRISPKKRKGGE